MQAASYTVRQGPSMLAA